MAQAPKEIRRRTRVHRHLLARITVVEFLPNANTPEIPA
jgi:hypothetical protein